MTPPFIPLGVRSHYSLMWGTASPEALCAHAKALGYSALALTDTDNLYGLWPFVHACEDHGIRPIIGAELTDPVLPHRVLALVKDPRGYAHLCRLISQRRQNPDFSLETGLAQWGRGLILLTKSPALLAHCHDQGLDTAGLLTRTPISQTHDLARTARKRNLPLVASPGAFFPTPRDHGDHTLLRAMDQNCAMDQIPPRDQAPASAFLADPAHYARAFDICPRALTATHELAQRLTFTRPDFGLVMPPLPPDSPLAGQEDQAPALLQRAVLEGATQRYGSPLPPRVKARINYELTIIRQKNFCRYFLVVQDIVKSASRICGRGSGAASIVAYCLGITNVCPMKFNLYFERFLNPGRQDPPDIDIDFAWDERDQILDQVLTRFKGHAAMVSSHILFQPRMAVRETARVFGLPESEISKVSRRLPWFWQLDSAEEDLLEQIKKRPEFKHMDFPQPWPRIMELARGLIQTPRYLSVHPGGVVITPDPIDTYVPVERATKGVPLIQWEKEGVESAGLVKIDLLGNRSLGVIRDAIADINTQSPGFDDFGGMDAEDDPDTQACLARGESMGCFYIESPAMRLLQKKSRVGNFEHVVIHSSIIRPAANDCIHQYLERLHTGGWEPLHPLLESVLDDSFGIMVYQEDVSRVAVALAGFSHDQADGLRKIMSKKDKTRELADFRDRFFNGAAQRGVTLEKTAQIWEMILSFSGYSFCKPHSASYARVSFQAAYLKTHYPAAFMAAVISNQGGFYSTFAYVSEARRLGVKLLGPDVEKSRDRWTGKGRGAGSVIRVGLMAIKALGRGCRERILRESKQGPFTGMEDFLNRARPREDEARALVQSGSLDRFNPEKNRSALLWQVKVWGQNRDRLQNGNGEPGLFDGGPAQIPPLPRESRGRRRQREFQALGFLVDCHPMSLYRDRLQGLVTAKTLPDYVGCRITTAGWLITGKLVRTKAGDPMKFLTFEDETGIMETVFFPRAYARFCHLLDTGSPYRIAGKVEEDWGAVTLTVDHVAPLT